MIQHEKFDLLEGIDLDKTDKQKECEICDYWHF